MSNLLAIPLIKLGVVTGTNEDWIDPLLFLVNDGLDPPQTQLDLRGIRFEMEVRRKTPDHEVALQASTDNGWLMIGEVPDYGYLIIQVPVSAISIEQPGEYVADIVGRDEVNTRTVVQIDLSLVEGVTR